MRLATRPELDLDRPPTNLSPCLQVLGIVKGILAVSLTLLALTACQGDENPEAVDHPSPDTSVPVHLRQINDHSQGGYGEGAYSYVRIENQDGEELIEAQFPLDGERLDANHSASTTTVQLERGSHRLVSFQRPCDGDCGSLDPPVDECSREVTVRNRPVEVTIMVQPGEGCAIEVE
jgi:hypothetical protein